MTVVNTDILEFFEMLLDAADGSFKHIECNGAGGKEKIETIRKALQSAMVEWMTVEKLEKVVNGRISEETALTPVGQRHATMCIIAEKYPNGIRIIQKEQTHMRTGVD